MDVAGGGGLGATGCSGNLAGAAGTMLTATGGAEGSAVGNRCGGMAGTKSTVVAGGRFGAGAGADLWVWR
jgi:hypothetical protein